MSLFGSFLGDVDDDPFFGGHMRQMNRMMNSFFSQPFGGMLGPGIGSELMPYSRQPMGGPGAAGAIMPFGFPSMGHMFGELANSPSCHSFSSSTVMTMNTGPDGRPQVYQASSSVRQGPGGIKETKKSVSDSQSGVKKLSIGHHIGDRAHIIEREQNVRTGDREERQEYINIEEDDADGFNQEWVQRTRHVTPGRRALTAPDRYSHHGTGRRLPAITAPSSSPHENPSTSTSPSPKSRKRQHPDDSDDSSSDEHQPKSTKKSTD